MEFNEVKSIKKKRGLEVSNRDAFIEENEVSTVDHCCKGLKQDLDKLEKKHGALIKSIMHYLNIADKAEIEKALNVISTLSKGIDYNSAKQQELDKLTLELHRKYNQFKAEVDEEKGYIDDESDQAQEKYVKSANYYNKVKNDIKKYKTSTLVVNVISIFFMLAITIAFSLTLNDKYNDIEVLKNNQKVLIDNYLDIENE